MGKVTELEISKERTVQKGEGLKVEYRIKANIELDIAKASLEGRLDGWLSTPQVSTSAVPTAPTSPSPQVKKSIEDIKKTFPKDDLADLLSFEEKENSIIIKPRQFLGSENFSKIASVVRGMGGDYVSAGKGSHFRVPLGTTKR